MNRPRIGMNMRKTKTRTKKSKETARETAIKKELIKYKGRLKHIHTYTHLTLHDCEKETQSANIVYIQAE
jgi:hypothetical protein